MDDDRCLEKIISEQELEIRSYRLLIGCAIQAAGGEIRLTERIMQESVFNRAIIREVDFKTMDVVYTIAQHGTRNVRDNTSTPR